MTAGALDAVTAAQDRSALYVSPITAWELGAATRKRRNRPDLGHDPAAWFRLALRTTGARLATITPAVASEAAVVPDTYGRADPGDCFLIATARVRSMTILTRDGPILRLAATRSGYLAAMPC
jgi:PIN domain nuclease of toxin-antitoxin system